MLHICVATVQFTLRLSGCCHHVFLKRGATDYEALIRKFVLVLLHQGLMVAFALLEGNKLVF